MRSPCIKTCKLNPDGTFCLGCGRSLEELAGWGSATEAMQAAILRTAAQRLADQAAPRAAVSSGSAAVARQ